MLNRGPGELMSRGRKRSPSEGSAPWPVERSEFTHRLRTLLPSTKTALNEGVERVLEVARSCGCLNDGAVDLEIALREALANAIIHGNAYRAGTRIFVRCYAGPRTGILILIRDEGIGFDPKQVPDPRDEDRMHLHHGRGLFLMRELMDHVEYRKGGSEVLLYKSCPEAEPS
jgi:serine/threonine-protein kinase RsbW